MKISKNKLSLLVIRLVLRFTIWNFILFYSYINFNSFRHGLLCLRRSLGIFFSFKVTAFKPVCNIGQDGKPANEC